MRSICPSVPPECRYGRRFSAGLGRRARIRPILHDHAGRGQLDHDDAPPRRIGDRQRSAGALRQGRLVADTAVTADGRSVHLWPDHYTHETDARQGAADLSVAALHLVCVRGADEAGQHVVAVGR